MIGFPKIRGIFFGESLDEGSSYFGVFIEAPLFWEATM